MAQSKKAPPRSRTKARAGKTAPAGRVPSRDAFLRFHLPPLLRRKTLDVLESLQASTDPARHRKALADLVVELTRCGMDAYFMKPLVIAKAGFVTEQSASLGMAGANQVLSSVIRNIIGSMGPPQLLSVCRSIRQFMQ